MEDGVIVELYWQRDQRAIGASEEKYGGLCRSLSWNILQSREDAEECVNDTWHRAWVTMPPQRPGSLRAYLVRIVRNLSIDRYRARRSQKRGGGFETLALELEDCVPAAPSAEAVWEAWEIAAVLDRWLAAEVTVPAGGSVHLTAAMKKAGSYDFYCADRGNQGLYGYDLVTALGSCLPCTEQWATLEDRGFIEIVRQNFGFALEAGIRTVLLDMSGPHYYLEVRSSSQ